MPSPKPQTLPAQTTLRSEDGPVRPRPRVPALGLGLGGAAIAAVYGITVMHMRVSPPLVVLALGGLTLVLSGIALWRMLDPLSRAELAQLAAPRARGRLRSSSAKKQLVLKAIKEVELDFQMRKIAEADYKEMIERYRARALRLISEIEAGDNFRPLIERELRDRLDVAEAASPEPPVAVSAPSESVSASGAAAPGAGATCPACGAKNDEDARFCKKCGGQLGPS